MSKHRTHRTKWNRLLSGVLCLALALGLLPTTGLIQPAEAAHWADPYAQQLLDWGVMTPASDLRLGATITRAEFVAMCNRAFGYKKLGSMPFVDVPASAWYAQDINIAYNAGYFTGTSADPANPKASPNGTLTREMAAVAVARNLMLQETVGESVGFTDSRELSDWSRGLIGTAVAEGVITGFPDGSFRPDSSITRGEVAALLVRLIGTPVNQAGSYSLGDVYGNVVISSSNVSLRDTVILGDLYVTGGVDLGNVLLENVTVLGKIVISGGGESHAAQSSVILRNVEADEMLVDSIIDQFVTISAYGVTDIPFTSVRTDAYVEDSCEAGYGLHLIELDGEAGTLLQLSGDIKEVVNKTPFSDLQLVKGTAQTITVDEYARGSQVLLSEGTLVYEMNLDVATLVMGKGDIRDLNISAAGCEVEILPEHVTMRPGITATVDGQVIGDLEAAEMSSDPRLLAGYPDVTNIAPTQAEGLFAVNKPGTIYWAISEVADGSVSVDDLLNNPAYGGNIYGDNAGNISASAKTEYGRQISTLVPDGSYYISAVMVDGRGQISPLKVAAFTTPDDTVPAFVDGYPFMTKTTCEIAQVTAMPNKDCLLYYALLEEGAAAPTAQAFKSGSVGVHYGYGSVNVAKNLPVSITVNRSRLQEKKTYWLYLWLTDVNGAQSMAAPVRLEFTTPDETPPIVSVPIQTDYGEEDAEVTYSMNEPGTLYWAVVTEGNQSFIADDADMTSLRTKLKVETGAGGANVIVYGNTPAAGANIDTVIRKDVLNGLLQSYGNSFKFFYVAKDADGNYSDEVKYIIIRTLDTTPPTVELDFSDYIGEGDSKRAQANSDVMLVFSEQVKGGASSTETFLDLYERAVAAGTPEALESLAIELSKYIEMYSIPSNGRPQKLTPRHELSENDEWVIDLRYATVTMDEGKMVVTLPAGTALNLSSGASYQFQLKSVFDNAFTPNGVMDTDNGNYSTGLYFTTVYAMVELRQNTGVTKIEDTSASDFAGFRLDIVVDVIPESTEKVPESELWDLIMWSDNIMSIDVYRKVLDKDGKDIDGEDWVQVNDSATATTGGITFGYVGSGVGLSSRKAAGYIAEYGQYETVQAGLNQERIYRYGIHITNIGTDAVSEGSDKTADPKSWNELVTMRFSLVAGDVTHIRNVSGQVNGRNNEDEYYNKYVKDENITEIGVWYTRTGTESILECTKPFVDTQAPSFRATYPSFNAGSGAITMTVGLNRAGTVYYLAAPVGVVNTSADGTTMITTKNDGRDGKVEGLSYIPADGPDRDKQENVDLIHFVKGDSDGNKKYASPGYLTVYNGNSSSSRAVSGHVTVGSADDTVEVNIGPLEPNTEYYIYIVLQGGGEPDQVVQIYRQDTTPIKPPAVQIQAAGTTGVRMLVNDIDSTSTGTYSGPMLYYALVEWNSVPTELLKYYDWRDSTGGNDNRGPYDTKPANAGNNVMTVLEAMMTTVSGKNGQTRFDVYGGEFGLKDYVYNYITNTTNDTLGYVPVMRFNGGSRANPTNEDFSTYMTSTTSEYVVLACARNEFTSATSGDSYGFAAARSLYKPDMYPPEYTGGTPLEASIISAYLTGDAPTAKVDWRTADTKENAHWYYYYNGTVTITFDKVVYYAQDGNANRTRQQVWSATSSAITSSTNPSKSNAISILSVITGSAASKFWIQTSKEGETNSFTLNFTKLTINDTIQLRFVCNSSTQSPVSTKTLTLRFDPTLTYQDFDESYTPIASPGFRVTWQ